MNEQDAGNIYRLFDVPLEANLEYEKTYPIGDS